MQEGTPGTDVIGAVDVAEDGSIYLAGTTSVAWVDDNTEGIDLVLAKLDPTGAVIWRWQVRQCRGFPFDIEMIIASSGK